MICKAKSCIAATAPVDNPKSLLDRPPHQAIPNEAGIAELKLPSFAGSALVHEGLEAKPFLTAKDDDADLIMKPEYACLTPQAENLLPSPPKVYNPS